MVRTVYRFRLYPTDEQKEMMDRHFGAVRWLWNRALEERIEVWKRVTTKTCPDCGQVNTSVRPEKKAKEGKKKIVLASGTAQPKARPTPSGPYWRCGFCNATHPVDWDPNEAMLDAFSQGKDLTKLKKEPDMLWLTELNAQSLASVFAHLDAAYQNFWRTKDPKAYPKFKALHHTRPSFEVRQGARVDFNAIRRFPGKPWNGFISVPKIPDIPAKLHRTFSGKIKTCTVSKSTTEKYFITMLVEEEGEYPDRQPVAAERSVGINLGIRYFGTLDTGERIENPRWLQKSLRKMRRLQRRLSKTEKGSNRRNKARLRVAILHEKIKNQRADFLHNTSRRLLTRFDTVFVEDWDIKGMIESDELNLNRRIHDVSWSEFNRMLAYKSDRFGKNVLKIERFEATTMTCAVCKFVNEKIGSRTSWKCAKCGHSHDTDWNAAINVRRKGLEVYLTNGKVLHLPKKVETETRATKAKKLKKEQEQILQQELVEVA